MNDGGYMNLPAKPTDQTTASIGGAAGRDVTSPADTLRTLLAQANRMDFRDVYVPSPAEQWIFTYADRVLALLDAAQEAVDNLAWVTPDLSYDALAAAVAALSEPRP